jgi:demethylmenaquinone methyltransferase / 2-methoxy-6-polyprenyl-1,4-benzoquinol methylase
VSSQTGTLPPEGVRCMFDRIAPLYDLMNRLMTAGLDQGWRRAAARAVVRPGDRVLDLCCGTGDLALAGQEEGGDVTAVDFSAPMLARARSKSSEIVWLEADALHLPLADASFDAVTIGFGLRNVASAEQGLAEMRRVLTPGGRLAVLDVTRPRGLLAPFYNVWFDALIPAVGKLLPGGAAFTYLPASVRRFPEPRELARLMDEAGFEQIRWRLFAGGIVALHSGVAR